LKKAHLLRCASIASLEFVFVKRVRARVDFLVTFMDTITITVCAASHLDRDIQG
jgi:hypothetical protein